LKEVKSWLLKQDAYTLHRSRRVRFKRLKTIAGAVDDQNQCDLIDLKSLTSYNDQYRYILVCLDVLSRRAMTTVLKTKDSVLDGLKKIFKTNPFPKFFLQTDKGGEFSGADVQAYLKKHNIHYFTTGDFDSKASLVERFNRTLLTSLHRYFTRNRTYRFLEILPRLTESYNNKVHSVTKYKPNEVTFKNQGRVWRTLHGKDWAALGAKKSKRPDDDIKIGDSVRIAPASSAKFLKGYRGLWSREIFIVRSKYSPTWGERTYGLKDENGEVVEGRYYRSEITKVDKTGEGAYYDIDEILRTKGKGVRKQYLVSWVGYSDKFNSWVKHKDLKKYGL
jgi:hypothetical protein